MSSDATTGEDLQPDAREDVQADIGETLDGNLQAGLPTATTADVESGNASVDKHGQRTVLEGAPADEPTGEPLAELADAIANDPGSAAGDIAGVAEQSPPTAASTAASAPESATPVSEAYAQGGGSSITAEPSRESDREPAPQAEPERVPDEALPELDLADQPTEIAPTWSDLAEHATQQRPNTPYTWSDAQALADPAYSPPDLPNAAPVEPWMVAAVSPDYEPPPDSYDSSRAPQIGAGMATDAPGRASALSVRGVPTSRVSDAPTIRPTIRAPPIRPNIRALCIRCRSNAAAASRSPASSRPSFSPR